jgi:hypothetical protein
MTWTHVALVDRRRSVHPPGNSAAGEPEIPNCTRPRMSLGAHKRQIHCIPSLGVWVISPRTTRECSFDSHANWHVVAASLSF